MLKTLKVGDKVRSTPLYVRNGVGTRLVRGTVTGVSRLSADYVRVRLDGKKSSALYAAVFWEHEAST